MINLKAEFVEIGDSRPGEMEWHYNCYAVEIEICNTDNIDDLFEERWNIQKKIAHELGFDTSDLLLIKSSGKYYLLKTSIHDDFYRDSGMDSVYDLINSGEEEKEISLKSNISIEDAIQWLKSLTEVTLSDAVENEKFNKYYWDESV
jgi:hypothetical protein